ncbi:MAG: hypothetical protein F4Z31_06155 [Gemmatimonadetes bacterium]|nr:hypothetical protein [Gemmatimonadota bacterium]
MNNKHNNPQSQDTFSSFKPIGELATADDHANLIDKLHIEAGNPAPYKPPIEIDRNQIKIGEDVPRLPKFPKRIWSRVCGEDDPNNAGVWLKPEQSQNHQFVNMNWTPEYLAHAFTLKFDHPRITPIDKWPRDQDGKPLWTSEALGLKPGLALPKPQALMTSIPTREPSRVDAMFILRTPVAIHSKRKTEKPIDFYNDVIRRAERKLGGKAIGKWDYGYNLNWFEFHNNSLHSKRLGIPDFDHCTLNQVNELLKTLPDAITLSRNDQICKDYKEGMEIKDIAMKNKLKSRRVEIILKENSIELRPSIASQTKKIKEMRARPMKVYEIADHFGCHRNTISSALNK